MPFTSLGMYDWDELREVTDRYWGFLRDALRDYDFDADEHLTRDDDYTAPWHDPDLLLSQTCGLPYVLSLQGHVSLLGAPAFDIDCGAGSYFSLLCVHQDSDFQTLEGFAGKTYAYNGEDSQSGFAALHHHFQPFYRQGLNFGKAFCSGGHRNSLKAVASGKADVAAIDAVCWALAERYEPATKKLRIFQSCTPTPATPYITAKRPQAEVTRIIQALSDGMAAADSNTLDQLLITGLAQMSDEDYAPVRENWNALPLDSIIR